MIPNWVFFFGAVILNDVLMGLIGYRYYKKIQAGFMSINLDRILHCETCGHPLIVSYDTESVQSCVHCKGYWCEECQENHVIEDSGYHAKTKKKVTK